VSQLGSTPLPAGYEPTNNNFSGQLSTSFELDFWGHLRRAKESARAQALSTRYAKDTVDLSLKGLIVSNYLLLRSLEAQITLTEDSLKSRDESLALTKRRQQGGVSSGLDVEQAQVASSNLVAQVADLKKQRDIAEHQLAVLTGDLSLTVPAGTLDSLPIPPVPPVGLPSSLLAARPDIRESEAQMIAANANIGVAKAALFPTISLTADYGGQSADLSNLLKSAARIWTGGLSLNLPIFDAGRLDARVDEATAKQKQALISYEASIQTGFKEVSDALVTLDRTSQQEAALLVSKDASKRALAIAENRYKSGYSGYLDVLDSQRTYNDAALSYIQSRQSRLTASVDLFKALGGGWKDPQQESIAQK
jgi:multidrug efflux system outer membrane protein